MARWLLNWLIFLPSVHFHYVTYYYLPSKQSTKNKLESAFFWDVLSQVWLLKLNEKEDFKRRRCIFAITLLFYLVIGEALCSNKLEKKNSFIRWILVRSLGEIVGEFLFWRRRCKCKQITDEQTDRWQVIKVVHLSLQLR